MDVLIFDLDDTLIAYNRAVLGTWQTVCERFCLEYPDLDPDHVFRTIRQSSREFWSDKDRHRQGRNGIEEARRRIVTAAFSKIGDFGPGFGVRLADNYSEKVLENIELFPDALETLAYFRDKGVILVLLTNGEKHIQTFKIEKFGLQNYFPYIFIEGEQGVGKPEPKAYQNVVDALNIGPAKMAMVGDNLEWDVLGPKGLGMTGIWHDWRQQGLPGDMSIKPDHIVTDIKQLTGIDLFSA